jgi:Domain of unknown function (DUF1905)
LVPILSAVDASFVGEVFYWRGPAPWHFVTVTPEISEALAARSSHVSYGWGMIPATARLGTTEWRTSLFRKDESYVVPLKTSVRHAEGIELGDVVTLHLHVDT